MFNHCLKPKLFFLFILLFLSSLSFNLKPLSPDSPSHEGLVKITKIPFSSHQTNLLHFKRGRQIEPTPMFIFPSPPNKNSTNLKLRQLSTENTLTNSGFIPLQNEYYAYYFIFTHLYPSKSNLIVYPYKFDYTPIEGNSQSYNNGGVFSLSPETFPEENASKFFTYVKTNTDVKIGKAKALYDVHIAIMKIDTKIEDIDTDLFYESDYYCSLLTTYIPKTKTCLRGKDALNEFKIKSPQKTAIVYLNHTEILNDALSIDDEENAFGILILPDHSLGSDGLIDEYLTSKGIDKIKKFIEKGGEVIATGKSGYLLEKWGIFDKGTFITSHTFKAKNSDAKVNITTNGNTIGKTPDENPSFEKQLLSMFLNNITYLTSTYPMMATEQSYVHIIATYNNVENDIELKETTNGAVSSIDENSMKYNILMAYLNYKKGKVVVINSNPLHKENYYFPIYNAVFLGMVKNAIFNGYVHLGIDDTLPIPGGESGVLLKGRVEFFNLFNTDINKYRLDIFFPKKINFTSIPDKCTNSSEEVKNLILSNYTYKTDYHLKCDIETVAQFDKVIIDIQLEIIDATATQKANDIIIFYPFAQFYDSETDKIEYLDINGVKAQAALAAILRGSINPDPSSCYPFPGKGYPADNELQVENKENTVAKEVVYYAVLPIVSPLLDGVNQQAVAISTIFYNDYYLKHIQSSPKNKECSDNDNSECLREYQFPFEQTGENEYLDFKELSGHDVILAADWDQPVKIRKRMRTEVFNSDEYENYPNYSNITSVDVRNKDYSTSINSPEIALQQLYFKDADKFYEHATQRLMPYIDITKEEGAATLFGDNIPDWCRDPTNPKICKRPVIFSRNDIYFYNSLGNYQMPSGINETFIISIDLYDKSNETCSEVFGYAKNEIIVKGYFNHTMEGGLKPNEWANLLFKTCGRKQYNPTNPEDLEKLGKDVKLIHYLVPIVDPTVKEPGNLMNFTQENSTYGYMNDYTSVKFIYGHTMKLKVPSEMTRQGGKFEIILTGINFIDGIEIALNSGYVTYSADQVSFYKTEIKEEGGTITIYAYFKRGLMPNESHGKDSQISIYFERLSQIENIKATLIIYEVKYDISSKETDYETYILKNSTSDIPLSYGPFYSLPAVEIATRMNRTNSTEIKEYELLMPYTRFGIYQQEIRQHRTVYGYPEVHNVRDPGLVSTSGGFATCSNIGTSSIPFVEYVTHGSGLLVPGAPRTSRIEWDDIWGRHWAQPLRSVFPDIPPLPPPLKNFMMSTTFQLLDKTGKNRILYWPSNEEAYIHIQLKFINNYPKFFLSTICPENKYPYIKQELNTFKLERIFDLDQELEEKRLKDSDIVNKYIQFGFSSVYGMCYNVDGAYLQGEKLDQTDFDWMEYAMTCADTMDGETIKICLDKLSEAKTKILTKRGDNDNNEIWNYSPSVDKFYPKGYIKPNMWDLTHYDYDDNAMDKAYKYHNDNNLPSLDVCPPQNPAYYKPHNVVAFPIFKGFGYKMSYSKDMNVQRFPEYKGWWSDNLQNMDDTLLAGQEVSNDISVGKKTLLPPEKWINYKDIEDPYGIIKNRVKNIYTCMYNQHRIKMSSGQKIYAFPHNVYQNNIVPIIPELEENDPRLTNFECKDDFYQYSPYNISQVDNLVETSTDRDWLYFTVNLRGGARENINILMKIEPIEGNKYEGVTKVQDGSRFVYWNPVNSPNSFLIVDNAINTVESYRNDLTVDSSIIPSSLLTFQQTIYQIYTVMDENEILREYSLSIYTNSYGFGDSTITVYVGGTEGSECKLIPGESTYIKIVFYNNCGFDWNLKQNAIDFEYKGSMAINANDLLSGLVHSIQAPKQYNFMKVNIPNELKDYITIKPSDHNIQTAPQFFDFENINTASIRDGFESNYFYKLTIAENFPNEYKGKMINFTIDILEQYFDNLPGPNDATGVHDYTLQIPPIKFGVKYGEDHPNKGKVYWTLGRATNVQVRTQIYNTLNIGGIKFITDEEIDEFRKLSGNNEDGVKGMEQYYNNLHTDDNEKIKYDIEIIDNKKFLNVYFNETSFSFFPKENKGNPDTAKFNIIVKSYADAIEYGYRTIIETTEVKYTDWKGIVESTTIEYPTQRYGTAKGAWLKSSYSYSLVDLSADGTYAVKEDQNLYLGDSGTLQVNLTANNVGSKESYDTYFIVKYGDNVELVNFNPDYEYSVSKIGDENVLVLNTEETIQSQELHTEILYFNYNTSLDSTSNLRALSSGSITILSSVSAGFALSDNPYGANVKVSQILDPFIIYFPDSGDREAIIPSIINTGSLRVPVFRIDAKSNTLNNERKYKFARLVEGIGGFSSEYEDITGIEDKNYAIDIPLTDKQTENISKYSVKYQITMYNMNEEFIAVGGIQYEVEFPDEGKGEIEEENEKKEKNEFPFWAGILIALVAMLFVFIGGYFIFTIVTRKGKPINWRVRITEANKENERDNFSFSKDNTRRGMIKGEELRISRFTPESMVELSPMK